MTNQIDSDVIVIGGGAAGLMCAAAAGARGRRVTVLEGSNRCGKKILMSGGGRCNFTNLYSEPANFLSRNPHFCKSALARYTPADFIALVEAHGVAYHEKERGQLFCDHSSKAIVALLLAECEAVGVTVRCRSPVTGVVREGEDEGRRDGFLVETEHGGYRAESVVVATGGLSIPKMGASGIGYRIAGDFGHALVETRAALVPFTDARAEAAGLAGVAAEVEARCNDAEFDGALLFTHRGLSGPTMLQLSSYWQAGDTVEIDWLAGEPGADWLAERARKRGDAQLAGALAERLPKRLAKYLADGLEEAAAAGRQARLKQLDAADRARIGERLNAWPFTPAGTEGYRTAEVTRGGVDTQGLSSATLESRQVPGLYFIGEVVDVTGHLGGHNFQWAWASGQAAGEVA